LTSIFLSFLLKHSPHFVLKKILLLISGLLFSFYISAQAPVANFSANVTSGCGSLIVEVIPSPKFQSSDEGIPIDWFSKWNVKGSGVL
jgi:hypothetical protein